MVEPELPRELSRYAAFPGDEDLDCCAAGVRLRAVLELDGAFLISGVAHGLWLGEHGTFEFDIAWDYGEPTFPYTGPVVERLTHWRIYQVPLAVVSSPLKMTTLWDPRNGQTLPLPRGTRATL